ncbi:MAG: helix-turn-helix transcriptional regulator [Clostridiales Family XIII bacterium]|nr:helix-turn-helix transcriptional regulator [Clostridiales Family XIII bacterium]
MFSQRLKALRKKRGFTQEALANAIGVERSSVGKYESRSVIPSSVVLINIARCLGTTIDYLLGNTDIPHTPVPVCPECEFVFTADKGQNPAEHERYHKRWKACKELYGFCFGYFTREKIKARYYEKMADAGSPFGERLEAAHDLIKAYFSKSYLSSPGGHISFARFATMFLTDKTHLIVQFSPDIYEALAYDYGLCKGSEADAGDAHPAGRHTAAGPAAAETPSRAKAKTEPGSDSGLMIMELIAITSALNADAIGKLLDQAKDMSQLPKYKLP